MTFDDLRSPWQKANGGLLSPQKREELVVRVGRRVERLGASIVRRDVIETVAAVVVIIFFTRALLKIEEPLAKLGAAIVVMGAGYVVYKMHRTRMDRAPSRLDASVREFCMTEIERLDRQIQLSRSVGWWYISPILIGVNLLYFGINGVTVGSVAYCVFTLLLGWWIYSLNQKAVAKSLLPVRDELSELFRELGDTK